MNEEIVAWIMDQCQLSPVTIYRANSKKSFENEIMDVKKCKSVTSA